MKKLLVLFLPLFMFAQCDYQLALNFDLPNNRVNVDAKIHINNQSIILDTTNFQIKNRPALQKALDNGNNKVAFSYTYTSKNIQKDFVYLLDNWYPQTTQPCTYTINSNLTHLTTVTEQTRKPIAHATFLADNYEINQTNYKNITIKTYFSKANAKWSQKYLNKTIQYIKLYEKLIAPFPYKHFNIVQNRYITGYSMPTYTLIGEYLISKPYMLNRSLGHEILHQYFGSAVYNDNTKGNYVEGLVTHLSDNYFAKLQNQEINNRKISLLNTQNFITQDFPAKEFAYRKDKNSMHIGYTKIAYIFQMLQHKIGEEKFFNLLQAFYKKYTFKEANLEHIQAFFQENTKEDLSPFFTQWFNQTGKIDLTLSNIQINYENEKFYIHFDLEQKSSAYTFDLPVHITTYEGSTVKNISITQKKQAIKIALNSQPLSFSVDPNFELFRALFKNEKPLYIGKLLNEKLLLVVNKAQEKQYKPLLKAFKKAKFIQANALTFKQLKENSVLFLDQNNELLNHFLPRLDVPRKSEFLILEKNTYNPQKIIGVLHSNARLNRSFMLLKHYAPYKSIIITQKGVNKKLDATQNGFKHTFSTKPTITQLTKPKKMDQIIHKIDKSKIIYASESHTNFTHHLNQLRIIKALYKKNKDLVIAMEMFQTPYQKALDDYLAHKIDLNTFLKQSKYYTTWKYDYDLYKPIIKYAQEKNIPIIAINTTRKTIRAISKEGILAFKDKEKLPSKIDQSNQQYKADLEKIYQEHLPKNSHEGAKKQAPNFKQDYFYQSQLIWDEAMGENIVKYMKQHPKKTMVVLVGSGHVHKHYGIPSRVYKETKLPYSVVLNDINEELLPEDIVIHNDSEVKIKPSPTLGVYLKNSKELIVDKVLENSLAHKIKLQKGDKLLKLNNIQLNGIADLKRALYLQKSRKYLTLEIQRQEKKQELKHLF